MSSQDIWEEAVSEITGGALIFIVGKLFSKAIGYVFTLVVIWMLGASSYGLYSYATSIIGVLMILAPIGADKSLLRFLPEVQEKKGDADGVVSLSLLTAATGGIILGMILYFAAPIISKWTLDDASFVLVLQIISLLLPINSILVAIAHTLRALKLVRLQVGIQQVLRPISKFLIVLVILYFGAEIYGLVVGLVISGFLTVLAGFWLLYNLTDLSVSRPNFDDGLTEYYNFSLPIAFRNVGGMLYSKTDILMLGFFVTSANVGYYNVAILLSTLTVLPLTGLNQIFPAFASELYHSDQMRQLAAIQSTLIRLTLIISLFLVASLAVYRIQVLAIFDREFTIAGIALLLLLFGQLFNALAYGSGYFLTVSDHQYLLMINQWTFGVLNVVLNYIAISELGIVGAALATGIVKATQNTTRIVECWYLESHFPYNRDVLNPFLPIIGTTICMLIVREVIGGTPAIFLGGGFGVLVYAVLLYAFGLTSEDKHLLREFYQQVASEIAEIL
jgi:O-antigen/teichoic acid export membrane protein